MLKQNSIPWHEWLWRVSDKEQCQPHTWARTFFLAINFASLISKSSHILGSKISGCQNRPQLNIFVFRYWFTALTADWWNQQTELTHCGCNIYSEAILSYHILVNTGSDNSLLHDGTKPLSEPILTYQQENLMAFIPGKSYLNTPGINSLVVFEIPVTCFQGQVN